MADLHDLGDRGIEALPLNEDAKRALRNIRAEMNDAYQEAFLELTATQRSMLSILERMQETFLLVLQQIAPTLAGTAPIAMRVAMDGAKPDLASAVVIADPIAKGYTLCQADIAQALGLTQPDVSVLVRAFKLTEDADCAVVVRTGKKTLVNYHPRAVDRFRKLLADPPRGLTGAANAAVQRARKSLIQATGSK